MKAPPALYLGWGVFYVYLCIKYVFNCCVRGFTIILNLFVLGRNIFLNHRGDY